MQGEIAEVGTKTGERRALLLARLGSKPQQKSFRKHEKSHISGYAKSGTGLNRLLFSTLAMHDSNLNGPKISKPQSLD